MISPENYFSVLPTSFLDRANNADKDGLITWTQTKKGKFESKFRG
jgi:hypothetical protein